MSYDTQCDDGSDESPDACKYLCSTVEGMWLCQDGTRCVKESFICDDMTDCPDWSDETSCGHCAKSDHAPCPGLSDFCIPAYRMCDGFGDCPDHSDESLDPDIGDCKDKCQSDGHHVCSDGSICGVGCVGARQCTNGEDEQSMFCPPYYLNCSHSGMFQCSEGGCVRNLLRCSARDSKQHLCNFNNSTAIGSDMDPGLCNGTCYHVYPKTVDFSRLPCHDGSMCLLRPRWCDGTVHCTDGSDELNCPAVVSLTSWHILLMTLALYLLILIFFRKLLNYFFIRRKSKPALFPKCLFQPSFKKISRLHRPSTIFRQLDIARVFFHPNQIFLLQLLERLELLGVPPSQQYLISRSLFTHLSSSAGVDEHVLLIYLKVSLGHCRQAQFLINSLNEPGCLDINAAKALHTVKSKFTTGKFTAVIHTSPTYFFALDFVKDITFLCLFSNSFRNLEESAASSDLCFPASPAEYGLFYSMIASLALSNFTTGIFCFTHSDKVFQKKHSNSLHQMIFTMTLLFCSPLLPLLFQLRLANIKHQLSKLGEELKFDSNAGRCSMKQALLREEFIDLNNIYSDTKLIEGNLEAILQVLFLGCFLVFYDYSFITTLGERYYYFYAISSSLINPDQNLPQTFLYFGTMLISLIGPPLAFCTRVDFYKRFSLNLSRKIVLVFFFLSSLVVRVMVVASILMMPVLIVNDFLQPVIGFDTTNKLTNVIRQTRFKDIFYTNMEVLSDQIALNAAFLFVFLAAHLTIVYLYSHLRVGSFRRAGMWARLVHGRANIWLTLPFRELQGVDRGEDVSQESFLLALHLLENVFLMIVAKGV